MPKASSVLAVCAHPDDESFGLGAIVDSFASNGATVSVLCFTRGEASTLGDCEPEELGELRRSELRAAAAQLGVERAKLCEYPDGSLASVPLRQLTGEVTAMAAEVGADLLLVFDEGGITGHPDHCRATEAALGLPGLPVLAWTIPGSVAGTLNCELGGTFVGRSADEIDMVVRVRRGAQQRAIACHASQNSDASPLRRRLGLLGENESLRWLRRPKLRS
ncbi:MAG TPA: PIG-L deacetylase family protein [Acidimicrobiales bacterium]|nr:PIG-L deacetylase family protein [Acidimicrobiales bacterium]